jgi:hypothetical protein
MGSNLRTLIVTTDHLEVIIAGLPKQIAHYKSLVANLEATNSGTTPIAEYWREQVTHAEQALELVRRAAK